MKLNILFAFLFLSIIVYASADFFTGISGATQLNGEGCLCHSLTSTASVNVWIEGPDTVAQGETAQYSIHMQGGPAVFGGFNVAARFNDLSPIDSTVHEFDFELTHSYPLPFTSGQVSWLFNYTADSLGWDTLYSVGNSVNGDTIPSETDQWNFGNKFPVFVTLPVPVELISFNAISENNGILLNWITATELNNKGFEVERSNTSTPLSMTEWERIGFVQGNGTTTSQNSYSFFDENLISGKPALPAGRYFYRLKQIDFDGTFSYSDVVTGNVNLNSFSLSQNYPNPFNPETKISFNLPEDGFVSLKIYNIQGEEVEVLSDGFRASGNQYIKWNASNLTSGVYFYKINFEGKSGIKFSDVKKMILTK